MTPRRWTRHCSQADGRQARAPHVGVVAAVLAATALSACQACSPAHPCDPDPGQMVQPIAANVPNYFEKLPEDIRRSIPKKELPPYPPRTEPLRGDGVSGVAASRYCYRTWSGQDCYTEPLPGASDRFVGGVQLMEPATVRAFTPPYSTMQGHSGSSYTAPSVMGDPTFAAAPLPPVPFAVAVPPRPGEHYRGPAQPPAATAPAIVPTAAPTAAPVAAPVAAPTAPPASGPMATSGSPRQLISPVAPRP